MYIQAPNEEQPITIRKGKPFKVKPAKRHEVPESYRKPINKKIESLLFEASLHLIGFTEFMKGNVTLWAPWSKKDK